MSKTGWIRLGWIAAAGLTLSACVSYPDAPRYSTRAGPAGVTSAEAVYGPPGGVAPPPYVPEEAPPPARAPVERIDGGGLPPAGLPPATPSRAGPPPAPVGAPVPPVYQAPAGETPPLRPTPSVAEPAVGAAASVGEGAAYVIQPGDTISGVGRRFQTPVQTLIDLNGLGPRGAIATGQRVVLPDSAVDTGIDPYATGPAPTGVLIPEDGALPPPPPPPSGNPATRPPASASTGPVRPPAAAAASNALVWPVRGDVLRRFGPVGLGEQNNGVNIGAPAGTAVVASAGGQVAYVGDDIVGSGLTVLITHPDGWRTVYGHLGSSTVEDGDTVRQGQQIGTVGVTAGDGRPSIHYETRRMQGDDPVAVDPLSVLPR